MFRMLPQMTVDNLLSDWEDDKFELMNTVMMKTKAKRKQLQAKMNETYTFIYPILSEGHQWTHPNEPIQDVSDVQIIKIYPE